jgi:hypothetical protein
MLAGWRPSKKVECGRTGVLSCPQIVEERPKTDRLGNLSCSLPFFSVSRRLTRIQADSGRQREEVTPERHDGLSFSTAD